MNRCLRWRNGGNAGSGLDTTRKRGGIGNRVGEFEGFDFLAGVWRCLCSHGFLLFLLWFCLGDISRWMHGQEDRFGIGILLVQYWRSWARYGYSRLWIEGWMDGSHFAWTR